MCVALPGMVIETDGTSALVDFSGNRVRARAGLVDIKPGDYVLVHAGCILQKVSKSERDMMEEIMEEVGAYQ